MYIYSKRREQPLFKSSTVNIHVSSKLIFYLEIKGWSVSELVERLFTKKKMLSLGFESELLSSSKKTFL